MTKYRLLREAAEATLPAVRVTEAPSASDGELALAHEPAWISAVAEGTISEAQQREIGFPWSQRMVERARRSVGATATGKLSRKEWGLTWNQALEFGGVAVSDEVKFTFHIAATAT